MVVELNKKKYNYVLGSPKHTVIEKVAAELAAVFYEAARSSGMKSEYKNPRSFARAKFTTFIPKAVELLISMLGRSDISDLQKKEIYEAIMERNNDPGFDAVLPNNLPDVDITKYLPKNEAPVIINSVLHNQIAKPKDPTAH